MSWRGVEVAIAAITLATALAVKAEHATARSSEASAPRPAPARTGESRLGIGVAAVFDVANRLVDDEPDRVEAPAPMWTACTAPRLAPTELSPRPVTMTRMGEPTIAAVPPRDYIFARFTGSPARPLPTRSRASSARRPPSPSRR